MKKKDKYEAAPPDVADALAHSQPVEDFLPPPSELVLKDDTTKVTLNLSRRSVEFFKKSGQKYGVPYQVMIKAVLDKYASHYRD